MTQHEQHAMHNGRPVLVRMGWDATLRGYFMVIAAEEQHNPNADEHGYIYSHLTDSDIRDTPWPDSIEHYKKILWWKNIEVPPEFFGRVLAD